MGCKANSREKRVKDRTTGCWVVTIDEKCNNKLMATKKLFKEPKKRLNIRRTRQKSRWQPSLNGVENSSTTDSRHKKNGPSSMNL
jgi:hypothetical protein